MDKKAPIDVVAAVIYHQTKNDGKYLIVRRGPDQSGAGFWEFPGGKVELGESKEDALLREIKEELNLDISIDKFLTEVVHSYPTKTIRLFVYLCSVVDDYQMFLEEHDLHLWQRPEDINLETLSAADRPVVQILRK